MFPFQNDVQVFGFITLLLIAMIPAKIASKKGYNFLTYYILGCLFLPVTIVTVLLMKNKNKKHTQDDQTENIEMYEKMYERGEISYNDFVAKKKSLEKNE